MKVNIAHASQNYEVLKPLVRRLVDSSGSVGQHAVGKIRSQFLVLHECRFNFVTCFKSKHVFNFIRLANRWQNQHMFFQYIFVPTFRSKDQTSLHGHVPSCPQQG